MTKISTYNRHDVMKAPGDMRFVSLEDLIESAALVPVHVGDPCWPGETSETHCKYDGKLCAIISRCGGFVWLREVGKGPEDDFDIRTSVKVQLVKLVPIAEAML